MRPRCSLRKLPQIRDAWSPREVDWNSENSGKCSWSQVCWLKDWWAGIKWERQCTPEAIIKDFQGWWNTPLRLRLLVGCPCAEGLGVNWTIPELLSNEEWSRGIYDSPEYRRFVDFPHKPLIVPISVPLGRPSFLEFSLDLKHKNNLASFWHIWISSCSRDQAPARHGNQRPLQMSNVSRCSVVRKIGVWFNLEL